VRRRGFNYAAAHVGATRGAPPLVLPGHSAKRDTAGYVVDHNRVRVGTGAADYARAQAVLEKWGCALSQALRVRVFAHAFCSSAGSSSSGGRPWSPARR
jgi:hypothetical protein